MYLRNHEGTANTYRNNNNNNITNLPINTLCFIPDSNGLTCHIYKMSNVMFTLINQAFELLYIRRKKNLIKFLGSSYKLNLISFYQKGKVFHVELTVYEWIKYRMSNTHTTVIASNWNFFWATLSFSMSKFFKSSLASTWLYLALYRFNYGYQTFHTLIDSSILYKIHKMQCVTSPDIIYLGWLVVSCFAHYQLNPFSFSNLTQVFGS